MKPLSFCAEKLLAWLKKIVPAFPDYLFYSALTYYILAFTVFTCLSFASHFYGAHDLGYYDQGIWNLSRFTTPYTTLSGGIIFAGHTAFYCILLAPIYWIWPHVSALLLIQTLCLGLAAVPVYLYAKEKLANPYLALSVGLSFLLYPALQNMNLDNFHPEVLAILPLSLSLFFALKKQYRAFLICAALAVLGKEEIGLTIFLLGLYVLIEQRAYRPALMAMGLGAAAFLAAAKLLLPIFNGINPFSDQRVVFSHWFQTLSDNLFNPRYYWNNFTSSQSVNYYLALLQPVAFLPLLGFRILLLTLAALSLNILSGIGYLTSINYHYDYVQTAVIFFALAEGLALIENINLKRPLLNWIKTMLLIVVLLFCAYTQNVARSHFPLPNQLSAISDRFAFSRSELVKAGDDAVRAVPRDAKVCASYTVFTQLSHRRFVYMFPNPFKAYYWGQWYAPGLDMPPGYQSVDYLVIDSNCTSGEDKLILDYLVNSGNYALIFRKGPCAVYKKAAKGLSNRQGVVYEVSKTGQKIGSGKVSMLYFPPAKYYFRNLLGEEIKCAAGEIISFSGYFFIPKTSDYTVNLHAPSFVSLLIDGQNVQGDHFLTQGFHSMKLTYAVGDQANGIELSLAAKDVPDFILPDQCFFTENNPSQFQTFLQQQAAFLREQSLLQSREPNLIQNPRFENISGNLPQDWKLEVWKDQEHGFDFYLEKNKVKQGNYSAAMKHNTLGVSRWKQLLSVETDSLYTLSGWIRTEGVTIGAGACLFVEGMGIRTTPLFGTNDWQFVSVTGRSALEKKQIEIQCRLGDYGASSQGNAYFDQIVLQKQLER